MWHHPHSVFPAWNALPRQSLLAEFLPSFNAQQMLPSLGGLAKLPLMRSICPLAKL